MGRVGWQVNTINAAHTEVNGVVTPSGLSTPPPCVAAPCPVADVLNAAADYMEKHGKCEGETQDEAGRVCAIGAIDTVTRDESFALFSYGVDALDVFLDGPWVADWSDDHDQATVISTMRACAAVERAKQPL